MRALLLNKCVLDFVAYVMDAVSWIAFGPTVRTQGSGFFMSGTCHSFGKFGDQCHLEVRLRM
jgi:hypothetical protein